jgi:two-component system chemotaxis response regulator CheY
MKTLIIDRAMLIQESVTKSLHDSGIEAIFAHSGEEALQKLSELSFKCIFLLLDLEETDDLELYKILKQQENFRHTPIVLLSTQNRPELIEDMISSTSRHISNRPAQDQQPLAPEDDTRAAAHINSTVSDTMEKQLRRFVHDYNNTFGIISGYADLLSPLLEDASDKHAFTEKIIQASNDGLKLTDRLLDFASGGIQKQQ